MIAGAVAAWHFVRSPAGKALGGVLLALLALSFSYNAGKGRAEADCNSAALQSQIDALKRDLFAAQESERTAKRLAAQAEAREQELNERLVGYETDLAAGGEPDCSKFSAGDIERLRRLLE